MRRPIPRDDASSPYARESHRGSISGGIVFRSAPMLEHVYVSEF